MNENKLNIKVSHQNLNILDQRLESLFSLLLQDISVLKQFKGVGDSTISALKEQRINTLWDLLSYPPAKVTSVQSKAFSECKQDDYCFIECTLIKKTFTSHANKGNVGSYSKVKHIVEIIDKFNQKGKIFFTSKVLPFSFRVGDKIVVYGKNSNNNFIHPKVYSLEWLSGNPILVQYFLSKPGSKALADSMIVKLIKVSLSLFESNDHNSFKDIITPNILHYKTFYQLFKYLHFGTQEEIMQAKKDLIILEAIAYHYVMREVHDKQKIKNSSFDSMKNSVLDSYENISESYQEIFENLRESLTDCQEKTLSAIEQDFKTLTPSQRMIFGDVGTGKTRVILLAGLYLISAKKQIIILCPTTLLAKQHYQTFKQTLSGTEISISLAIQSTTTSNKTNEYFEDIVIGTHALFQEKTKFRDIGLIVIDEQHKFGVKQRHSLLEKQNTTVAHILSLSATPIPRSLMMIFQNYTSVSILKTKPRPVEIKTSMTSVKQKYEIISLKGKNSRK